MNTKKRYAAATVLAFALAAAPATAQNQPANQQQSTQSQATSDTIVKGSFRGLRFIVHRAGHQMSSQPKADELHVTVPNNAKLLGAKWDGRNVVLSYRLSSSLQNVYRQHAEQLTRQGFKRQGNAPQINDGTRDISTKFERSNDVVELKLNRGDNNSYRVMLDLEAVRDRNQQAAVTQPNTANQTRPNTQGNQAQGQANNTANRDPNAPVLERRGPDGIAYMVYAVPIEMTNNPNAIRIGAPPNATISNARAEDEDILFDVRRTGSLADLGKFYDEQLTRQGFRRTATGDNNNDAWNATYLRGENRIELDIDRTGDNTFRVLYNFEGARDGNNVNTPAATGNNTGGNNANKPNNPAAGGAKQNYQESVRAQMGNSVLVTVLPVGYDRPTSNTSNTQFALVPPKDATEATVNIDGHMVLIGYLAPGTLQEQFKWFDDQFKTLGFKPDTPDSVTSTNTNDAAQKERKATYTRGDGKVEVTVQRWDAGDKPGWRLMANFDNYVKSLKK